MDKKTFDNAIKIAVVRNPWERMASYYRYRQLKNQDPKDFPFSYWLRSGSIQYNMGNFDMMPQCKWLNKIDSFDMPKCVDYVFNYDLLESQWKEFCEIEKINAKPLKTLLATNAPLLILYTYGRVPPLVVTVISPSLTPQLASTTLNVEIGPSTTITVIVVS